MIRIGIVGYGNLGKGVAKVSKLHPDMYLQVIFTRRPPTAIDSPTRSDGSQIPVVSITSALDWQEQIDVLLLCGGSAADLPEWGPRFAAHFNTVDSFDTHAKIPAYYRQMHEVAASESHLCLISCGWDPGLFSLTRVLFSSILPQGHGYTFWGRGVSQGHSDAIRRIPGVVDARQYTQPVSQAVEIARSDRPSALGAREKHKRICYVVAQAGADLAAIREAIVTMPHYFADYDTTVTFISADQLAAEHGALPHGGFVIRNGVTSEQTRQIAEFSLRLASNPEFTASVLVAYARAVHRMRARGEVGAITIMDVPPGLLSPSTAEDLRAQML